MNQTDPRAAGGWQPTYEPTMFERILTAAMCDDVIVKATQVGFETSPVFYGDAPASQPDYRRSETAWLKPDDHPELYAEITRHLNRCNDRLYRFAIYGMDQIQVIRYLPGCFFIDHVDIGHAHAAHRKISLIVQLSDPGNYEGGDVVLTGRITIPKQRGGGCVFPSWVQHRVDPITSGTRYSLAAWARGTWFN